MARNRRRHGLLPLLMMGILALSAVSMARSDENKGAADNNDDKSNNGNPAQLPPPAVPTAQGPQGDNGPAGAGPGVVTTPMNAKADANEDKKDAAGSKGEAEPPFKSPPKATGAAALATNPLISSTYLASAKGMSDITNAVQQCLSMRIGNQAADSLNVENILTEAGQSRRLVSSGRSE